MHTVPLDRPRQAGGLLSAEPVAVHAGAHLEDAEAAVDGATDGGA